MKNAEQYGAETKNTREFWPPGVLYAAEKLTQLNQRKMQVFRFGHTD